MARKYRALRSVAFLLQVLAWMSLILGVFAAGAAILAGAFRWVDIGALAGAAGGSAAGLLIGFAAGAVAFLIGALNYILFLAFSQAIFLQIDVEQNTRMTADVLRQIARGQAATSPVPADVSDLPNPPVDPATFMPPTSNAASPTITTEVPPQV